MLGSNEQTFLGLGVTGSESESDSHRLQVMQKRCHHDGVKSVQHHCSLGQFTQKLASSGDRTLSHPSSKPLGPFR
jgi:hypothetical protein